MNTFQKIAKELADKINFTGKNAKLVAYLHPTKGWKKRSSIKTNKVIAVLTDDLRIKVLDKKK